MHGTGQSVTNSTIERSWPAVYVAPIYVADMRDTTIKGNSFNDCLRGVVFNAGGQYPITNVTVEDNIFR